MTNRTQRFLPPLLLLIAAALFLLPGLFAADGHALGSHDMRGLFYPWLEFVQNSLQHGRVPFWDSALFAGYPFLANPQVAFFYPLTWLAILLPLNLGFTLYLLVHLWLAGWGMYLFVNEQLTMNKEQKGSHHSPFTIHNSQFIIAPAFLAALTFMFSGFFAARIYAGHIGLLAVHVWVPWLLLATSWSVRKGNWPTAVVAGLPFGLAILAGHTTSLIYVGLIWGAWAFYLLLPYLWAKNGSATRLVMRQVAIAGVVGLLLAAVQLLPLLQLTQAADRTASANFAFASGFSFPPTHLITLLVPEFFGEPTRTGYWSVPTFEELAAYAGLLPLLIVPLVLRRATRPIWFFMGLGLVGILLALGSYGFLFEILYELFPPFRLARAPGRAMFLYVFSASALLGLALGQREAQATDWWRWWVGITAVSGLTALAATGAVFASVHPTETSGRLWHQLGGWGVFTAVVIIGGLLLWRWFQPRPPRWLPFALTLLIISDLWLFGAKLIIVEEMTPDAFWFGARDIIGETDQRILPWGVSIFAQNGAAQVGLNSVFGYNALELGANTALASSIPDPRSTAYDILGAGYVVAQSPLDQFTEGEGGLQFIGEQNGGWVYARPRPFALARLVYAAEIIPDQQTAIGRVHQPDFNPATTAILASDPACSLPASGTGTGTAEIISQEPTAWRIQTSSDEAALLLLSETAYPGWEVSVNGEQAEWQTAYTAVRAVCVPAGQNLVEWTFRPWIFLWGGLLSLLGVALVGMALGTMRTTTSD